MKNEEEISRLSDYDLAKLFSRVKSVAEKRGIDNDLAFTLLQSPELVEKCSAVLGSPELAEDGESILQADEAFTHGVVYVNMERPDRHPSYIQLKSHDDGRLLRLLTPFNLDGPYELAKIVAKENKDELDRL